MMGPDALRLIVVDDDRAIMECLGDCLRQRFNLEVAGYAEHAQQGVALTLATSPDVVLMDIHMPGADAFWACRQLVQHPDLEVQVLFFTGYPVDHYVDRCLAAGGAGVFSKHTSDLEELALAVRHVHRGGRYFSPELSDRLVQLDGGANLSRLATLAAREIDVLRLMADGKTNRQISRLLDISLRSVEKEIADLKQKLEMPTTAELLVYAVREGLVFPECSSRVAHTV